jgi:hypothetical protein
MATDVLRAGDLTVNQIGKTLRVKIGAHVTIEDEVEALGHVSLNPGTKTLIVFATISADDSIDPMGITAIFAGLHPRRGFLLPHDTLVTVVA